MMLGIDVDDVPRFYRWTVASSTGEVLDSGVHMMTPTGADNVWRGLSDEWRKAGVLAVVVSVFPA